MPRKPYYPAPHIRHCRVEDRVVILDLHSESYLALDPTASAMWQLLTSPGGCDESQRILQDHYEDDNAQLQTDFDSFTQRCLTEGYLTETQEPPFPETGVPVRRLAGGRFLTLRAWWSLWSVTRSLAKRGFSHTYDTVQHLSKMPEIPANRQSFWLAKAIKAFGRAENFFYLKKAPRDCLPRSLALFRFLRILGLPAEHCIGVQQFPFLAHAWSEYQGDVLHDDLRNQERYTVIARIPA